MSEFLAKRYEHACPYHPGEQPKDRPYIKLNANETSVPPSPKVRETLADPALYEGLGKYADPFCMPLREAVASRYGVTPDEVFAGNGSDEVLGFIMQTFFEPGSRVCFPDITYGFYHDYAATFNLDWQEVPLKEDFTLDVDAFCATDRHVLIANPNAPTGLVVPPSDIARICEAHPKRLVVLDEAYVDYGNESCIPLVASHRNLIVVQTMSKSRNLAGAHIGFAIAQADLVSDLNDIKFSFNPFNLSKPTMAIGIAALSDEEYFKKCTSQIEQTRDESADELRKLGFIVLPSHANFLFATHPVLKATDWCQQLRKAGILTRHYATPERIENWLRITVGTPDEMSAFLTETRHILGEACIRKDA